MSVIKYNNLSSWVFSPLIVLIAVTVSFNTAYADCNPEKGAKIFKKCVACHAIEGKGGKVGPGLDGVVGRKSGSFPDFKYSRALRELNIIWTSETLDEFLTSPQKYARGTGMAFSGLKKERKREDLICFLKTLTSP
tara:strand:- start:5683 stop:6090 length:408 start_codon:yes stop_codon:yes gene_type:complete